MNDRPKRGKWGVWPAPIYWVCYGVLGVILVYVLVLGWLRPVFLDDPIQVIPGAAERIELRLDPNVAGWAELTQLPRIGPALAKRIVAYRQDQLAIGPPTAQTVFACPEDLAAVPGIGPKTVEQLRPYLMFPEQ